jgi:hypothetical protein
MAAWGAGAGRYPAGWSHSPEGYVQPGQLALYRPSMNFTDYRLEFFGQIESKSMAWVVRARDSENYYAMKVSVLEPGLRPIVAIEHYPVVRGKKGHSVGMPLNVMVHNNTPVLVAVVVKGNRFTASIEGQQVDSWTDDAPASGGVGFLSDAGARARLYWVRVSKNQDLVGRVCAYFAGGRPAETAALMLFPGAPIPVPYSAPRPDFAGTVLAVRRECPMPAGHNAIVKDRRREPWS